MAACVAETLAAADLGEHTNPRRAIAVIQAGTGVGKSAAYAVPAIALALERKTRVIISTATVALQEQLIGKDLPALSKAMDQPFTFALAKGRGRYVCKLKLERLVGSAADAALFDGDDASVATSRASALSEEAQLERRQRTFESMATATAWLTHPTPATGLWLPPSATPAPCAIARTFADAATTRPDCGWPTRTSSLPTMIWCWRL